MKSCAESSHLPEERSAGVLPFVTLSPGLLPYDEGLQLQERLLQERRERSSDILLLLEHPPVITLGRNGRGEHLLLAEKVLAAQGVAVHRVPRGGDVTCHAPGQLVGYPIVDLQPLGRDLHRYLRLLEESLILTLAAFGLSGRRHPDYTGVWVGDAKIASIGVGVRHWISWHGFALNVNNDLALFETIVPCGLSGVTMTSMAELLGRTIAMDAVKAATIEAFAQNFGRDYQGCYVDLNVA